MAGHPTNFPLKIKQYEKIHTVRTNYGLWLKRLEEVQKGLAIISVRIWTGKPYKSKQGEIFKYDNTRQVGVQKLLFDGTKYWVGKNQISVDELSKNDGLTKEQFMEWFKDAPINEPLAIIHFTSFRY
ncbi:hypothetical protein GBO34_19490 [Roseivirga pacifica]|nr:hypothetical protein [Roseivirga pacifica]MCO6366635.1 hypothetical protein [Roseivirga pacifica]MCO6371120.1 hypothetical protein [Roseivirga pacifica]MCO6373928.1 hypothetical protein [Roseivirga pacifica]MCO6380909.1 hypothetical protein [Roseivirga pacifica]